MEMLNYSVKDMVDAFSFDDFFQPNMTSKRKMGFLLITGKQLIYGYTHNYGIGSHDGSLSNALREIYGMEVIATEGEQYRICDEIKNNYISAHFANEADIGVYLAFYLQNLKAISPDELALFEQFYNKYNDTIYNYSKAVGHPVVTVVLPALDTPIIDEFGYENDINTIVCDDLTEILNYLRRIVSDKKVLPEDRKIIGEALSTKKR